MNKENIDRLKEKWMRDEALTSEDMHYLFQVLNEWGRDIDFFKKRERLNKEITQELINLNNQDVREILTRTRII